MLTESQRVRKTIIEFDGDMELTDHIFVEQGEDATRNEITSVTTALFVRTGQYERESNGDFRLAQKKKIPITNMVGTVCWRLINDKSKGQIDAEKNKKKGAADIAKQLAKGKAVASDSDSD